MCVFVFQTSNSKKRTQPPGLPITASNRTTTVKVRTGNRRGHLLTNSSNNNNRQPNLLQTRQVRDVTSLRNSIVGIFSMIFVYF